MSRPSSRRLVAGVAVLVAGGLLSGCGVSDHQVRPGLAAQVGDHEITIDELDDTVTGVCAYLTENPDPNQTIKRIPRSSLRAQLLSFLIQESLAQQVIDETGDELDPGYAAAVSDLGQQLESVPDEAQRAGLKTVNEAQLYFQAAQSGVGTAQMTRSGVAEPTSDQVAEAAVRVFTDWVAGHVIDVNPMFGVSVVDGAIVVDGIDSTAVASTEFSKGADLTDQVLAAVEPPTDEAISDVAAYADSLPDDQACG